MTNEERIHRASLASAVLENEAFVAALESLAETYIAAWKSGKTVEAREDAHRYYQLCEKFASDLKSMILDGVITSKRVHELEGKRRVW